MLKNLQKPEKRVPDVIGHGFGSLTKFVDTLGVLFIKHKFQIRQFLQCFGNVPNWDNRRPQHESVVRESLKILSRIPPLKTMLPGDSLHSLLVVPVLKASNVRRHFTQVGCLKKGNIGARPIYIELRSTLEYMFGADAWRRLDREIRKRDGQKV